LRIMTSSDVFAVKSHKIKTYFTAYGSIKDNLH